MTKVVCIIIQKCDKKLHNFWVHYGIYEPNCICEIKAQTLTNIDNCYIVIYSHEFPNHLFYINHGLIQFTLGVSPSFGTVL